MKRGFRLTSIWRLISEMITVHRNEEVIKEGLASIIIPRLELYKRPDGSIEPAWMPVFYNPHAIVSRDFTILFLRGVMGDRDFIFLDSLGGSGVRAIRIALESNGIGIVNDIDPRAYYYIRRNVDLNNLRDRIQVYNNEANVILNNLVFTGVFLDYIDVDPYGSPIPFIDSAFKPLSKRAYIGVTATDTAPLSCTYPNKTLIRYWSKCIKVDFEKEYAIRLLIAVLVQRASALEIALEPLLSFIHRHYIRVFFKTERSAKKAYDIINNCIGYTWYCKNTLEKGFVKTPEEASSITCYDGSSPILLGKTWICSIEDVETINKLVVESTKISWLNKETVKILSVLKNEVDVNKHYIRLDKLCGLYKTNIPDIISLINELKSMGVRCSRTHLDPKGIRVDASHEILVNSILKLSLRRI